ncbi:MAG: hypothetical protein GTN36_01705 [Candidatus Aenigmarchaeota archaeon]|nr:hypothetical protein [Candidatus Aenigmarchaeota archaeon]
MAFEYLGGSTDLFNLVFREILKIDPSLLYKYATVQDQVIYLLLIPMLVLFLFVYAFSRQIVLRIAGEHKGFQYLVSIIVFIYLIYSGIFGTTLVPIFTTWLNIALALSLIVFVISVVIHPARGPALTKLGHQTGKMLGKKMFEKTKKIDALENEIDVIDKQMRRTEQRLRRPEVRNNDRAVSDLNSKLNDLENKKERLKEEIDRLGG